MIFNRGHKYKAKKVEVDGIKFDSKLEAERYKYLKNLQYDKKISDLKLQERFELQPTFKDKNNKTIRAMHYIADFSYKKDGEYVVEDVKGFETSDFKLKKKLFLYKYPAITFKIIKKEDLYN